MKLRMRVFVLLCAFLAAASAASLGTEKCSWGPSYWCDHPLKAKLCGDGATKFCLENNWAKITAEDDTICDDCEMFVSDFHDLLNNAEVQKDIVTAVKELCNDLKSEATVCKLAVDMYGLEFLEKLISGLDSVQFCSLMKLCTSYMPEMTNELVQVIPAANGDVCAECKKIFADIQDILNNPTVQSQLSSTLTKVCQDLGVPSNLCQEGIDQFLPLALQYLVPLLDGNTICPEAQLCGKGAFSQFGQIIANIKLITVADGDPCAECQEIIADLGDILSNTTVQNNILKEANIICALVGIPSDTCSTYINSYGPIVFEILTQYLTPDVCTDVKLCSGQSRIFVAKPVPAIQGMMRAMELVPALPVSVSGPAAKVSISTCDICTLVATEIESFLKKGGTQAGIESCLDKVCSYLPSEYEQQCQDFVNEYTPMIIELLETLQPSQICQALKLCTSSQDATAELRVGNAVTCEVCQYVMTYLDQVLSESSTKTEIEDALDKVCGYLPSSISQECQAFVSQYTDEIIELLETLKPSQICQALKLCTSSQNGAAVVKVSSPVTCEVCQTAMAYLEKMLSNNATKAEIENALDKLCGYLPSQYGQECQNLINQYAPEIIELLETLTPSQICQALKLCTSSQAQSVVTAKGPVKDAVQCEICKYVMEELKSSLSDNATKDEILAALDKVCSLLPSSVRSECDAFINKYGPMIFQLLGSVSPSQICEVLSLCSPVKEVKSDSLCTVCEVGFGILETQIESNKTLEEITETIEKVCTVLPADLGKQCKGFLDTYGPMLLKMVVNSELSPNAICKDLKLCTAAVKPSQLRLRGAEECAVCKEVVTLLDNELKNNQEAVLTELTKLCSLLPTADQQTCVNYVTVYGSYILQLLLEEVLTPQGICTDLKLCSASNPCLQGPVYWCANMDNAKLCNTVDHCRRHAWN